MKLESVSIERFRSIEAAELPACGPFNVLIGKNNSGKSNILSALQAFFACIQDGSAVNLSPVLGRDIDFFGGKRQSDILLRASFVLELAERDSLLREIVAEAPQMKNAADGIDPFLRLTVTVRITAAAPSFSYVSRVVITALSSNELKQGVTDRTLLEMDLEAAREIQEQKLKSRQEKESIKQLKTLNQFLHSEHHREMLPRVMRDEDGEVPIEFFAQLVDGFREEGLSRLRASTGDTASRKELKRILDDLVKKSQESLASLEPAPLKHKIGTFAGDQTAIPNYLHALLIQISQIKVLHLPERRKPIGRKEAEQLLNLKVERGGPQILRNIQESVMALLGVQIDAFRSSRMARGTEEPSAEMDIDNFLAEANGSGIREALRVILDVEFGSPAILLVEEPEIHLHPALETSLMRFLKRISRECQVFITTHSTNFLDTAEMRNVYLVSKSGSTHVQQLSLGEAESRIPQELGIRLSSLFMFDRLVFVEGPSDETVIREWASTLGVNLSQANVGFIAMGSVRNFAHFAAESTLLFLTKRQVKIWFLIDKDEKEEADIAKLREKLGGNAVLEVLDKREIENYMIQPRPIVEFIALKYNLGGSRGTASIPTLTDVSQSIEDVAEKLKAFAIEKKVDKLLCRPAFPSSRREFGKNETAPDASQIVAEIDKMIVQLNEARSCVPQVLNEQTQRVESTWLTNKLDVVPGDQLLDKVCQKFGTRFNKDRDSSRLASLMKEEEIDTRIKRIIREIGNTAL